MKKKTFIFLFLIIISLFSIVGCNNLSSNTKEKHPDENKEIEILLPKSVIGEMKFELDDRSKELGIKEIVTQEDSSVILKTDSNSYNNILSEITNTADNKIKEILSDTEHYPPFTSIEYNEDFTEVNIKVDKNLYDTSWGMYVLSFYLYGDFYQAVESIPDEKINTIINFIDVNTDEIIESNDSNYMCNPENF